MLERIKKEKRNREGKKKNYIKFLFLPDISKRLVPTFRNLFRGSICEVTSIIRKEKRKCKEKGKERINIAKRKIEITNRAKTASSGARCYDLRKEKREKKKRKKKKKKKKKKEKEKQKEKEKEKEKKEICKRLTFISFHLISLIPTKTKNHSIRIFLLFLFLIPILIAQKRQKKQKRPVFLKNLDDTKKLMSQQDHQIHTLPSICYSVL